MKRAILIATLLISTYSCSNSDDRPNCLELNTGTGDFDPTIRSCEEIQAMTAVDCSCN